MQVNKKLAAMLSKMAYYIEVLISLVLMLAVLILLVELIIESGIFWHGEQHMEFNSFLSGLFNLVIGVAFTKMLCKHTPDTVVDVLMFSVARRFIITHIDIWDNLLGVATLAILFAIRKYLMPHNLEKSGIENTVY